MSAHAEPTRRFDDGADQVVVRLTRTQLAFIRRELLRELHEMAGVLADHAGEASDAPDGHPAAGDARGAYHILVKDVADVLDAIGWETSGDHALLTRSTRELLAADEKPRAEMAADDYVQKSERGALNAVDRAAGEIIARYLHEQDPRWVWEVLPAPASERDQREGER
jgi:hypothetical protein